MSRGDPYYQFYKNAPLSEAPMKQSVQILRTLAGMVISYMVKQSYSFNGYVCCSVRQNVKSLLINQRKGFSGMNSQPMMNEVCDILREIIDSYISSS